MADQVFQSATGGATGIRYGKETTLGVPPEVATANFFELRNTGCTLGVSKSSFTSKELRSDRMVSELRHGNIKVSGNLPFELSFKEYDDLLAGVCFGSWDANVLKCGTTKNSFFFERFFSDLATPYYQHFTGIMCDSLSLEVKPDDVVSGTFGLVGLTGALSATSLLTTGSPTASQTYAPYDSFTGSITEGGSTISVVTSLKIDLKNSIDPAYVIGQKTAGALPAGRSELTGTVSCFFVDPTMVNKFLNETESSLVFTLGDGATESYTFTIPRIKYTSGQPDVSDEGQIEVSMDFTALVDSVSGTNMSITRTAA